MAHLARGGHPDQSCVPRPFLAIAVHLLHCRSAPLVDHHRAHLAPRPRPLTHSRPLHLPRHPRPRPPTALRHHQPRQAPRHPHLRCASSILSTSCIEFAAREKDMKHTPAAAQSSPLMLRCPAAACCKPSLSSLPSRMCCASQHSFKGPSAFLIMRISMSNTSAIRCTICWQYGPQPKSLVQGKCLCH